MTPPPPAPAPPEIHIHYLRPPDREEVFHQRLLHDGPEGKVTLATDVPIDPPVVIHGEIALERGASAVWTTFPGRWHDIGRFHRADGTFTGYYANVLTPPEFLDGGVWRTMDLFLDVWLTPGGNAFLLDEDQLAEAVRRGWIDAATAERAREEAAAILSGIADGSWPPPIARKWTLERALTTLPPPGGPRRAD
ncbi:MAG: DUF402 domain-containing protein [Gemmatimonadota bacterium]